LPFEWSAGLPVPQDAWWLLRDELFALEEGKDARGWLAAVVGAVAAVAEAKCTARVPTSAGSRHGLMF
jgi:hypothetical protein